MNNIQVVLATTNAGKIAELTAALAPLGVTVLPLSDFPAIPDIVEDGETFTENALKKARTVAQATDLVAIADDSGLMVDALGGAPGVHSARYGDDWEPLPGESRDARNMRKLVHEMQPWGIGKRACHFVTAIAVAAPNGAELVCEGEWHGELLESPLGDNGFGYDPLFWDVTLGKSAAELTKEEKNAVSHRGKAVRKLVSRWPEFLQLLGNNTAK